MQKKTTRNVLAGTAFALFIALSAFSSVADAANISFSNVFQSTQTAGDPADLFGPPTTPLPDTLTFTNPAVFSAQATGVNDIDITDGFLSFDVSAGDDTFITGFSISEVVTYSIFPSTATDNEVQAIITGGVTITEINGVPVVVPAVTFNVQEDYTLADGSGAQTISATVDFAVEGITGIQIGFNNRLSAFSAFGSSFIDKKRVDITIDKVVVPEPNSLALAALGLLGILAKRRTT